MKELDPNLTNKQLMVVERTLVKKDCFYCTYCQRIKVNSLLVDRYCEKYLCLIDEVEDCQEFVHVKGVLND